MYVNAPTVIEWESKAKIGSLPIISLGANAKGVVAIGTRAQGVLAMGVFCRGIISLGVFSMGVFSFGALSLGVLAIGALAAGLLAAGGIAADEIDPATFAVKRLPGVYAAGEVLDVDGNCGGYNLQFAWSSAYAASQAIIQNR